MNWLRFLNRYLWSFGLRLENIANPYPDFTPWEREIIDSVQPYSMTSPERIWAVCNAVAYVTKHKIPGDIVECGVWRGGCMMAAALALQHFHDTQRFLWLYDTFEGMTPSSGKDRSTVTGLTAAQTLESQKGTSLHITQDRVGEWRWAWAALDDVTKNLASTGYARSHMRFVKGPVERTIPDDIPDQIAILRLDTDWYDSTRHELEHLFPRLVSGGVLIIDDYGQWLGARHATDEYFDKNHIRLLLTRSDYTGRVGVKQ